MAGVDYIVFKKGNAYYRRRVPADIAEIIGRAEWTVPLKTKDVKVARVRAAAVALDLALRIRQARDAREPMHEEVISVLAAERAQRTADELRSASLLGEREAVDAANAIRDRLCAYSVAYATDDFSLVYPVAAEIFIAQKRRPDQTRPDYRQLAKAIVTHEIRAIHQHIFAGTGGVFAAVAASAKGQSKPGVLHADSGKTPLELFQRFSDHNAAKNKATLKGYYGTIKFLQHVTKTKPISEIDSNDLINFYDLLIKCPQHYKSRLKVDAVEKAIEMNKTRNIPANTAATVKKKLVQTRMFFAWAAQLNLTHRNPAQNLKHKAPRTPPVSKSFSERDIVLIYRHKTFTRPGARNTWKFWTPLLLHHTGARLGEICALTKAQYHESADCAWLTIRSTKTAMAYDVPLHPNLVRLGFSDYVRKQSGLLFPTLPKDSAALSYAPVSKWFARLLVSVGAKRPGVNLHAYRHTFITACRNANLSKDVAMALVGHKGASVHDAYGDPINLQTRISAVNSLAFTGFDHLFS
ncbi:integrase [Alphaproteobacteria bacterium]|nr:integrase [Alphaproteobacteria bacterium]